MRQRLLQGGCNARQARLGDARFARRDFLQGGRRRCRRSGVARRSAALAEEPVELTFWAWCPGSKEMSQKFMEKYPNIKVKYENVGQGAPHYVKLRDALKAGTGLPDVAQMEFNSIRASRR